MIDWKDSPGKGRGVYAAREFRPGEVVESAPVIVIPADQRPLIAETVLDAYVFEWGESGREVAIALGLGSLYNHACPPNARFVRDLARARLDFACIAPIAEGEEITINYHGDPGDSTPILFEGDGWIIP